MIRNFFKFYHYYYYYYFTLQYYIGSAIHQHASATGVHVFPILNPLPSPFPYHPSGSSQCSSPKLPVFCIEPGLVIRFLYDIIHVLMPFSQIIPRSLSHRVEKTILYICVSFAVSHTVRILILLFQYKFLLFLLLLLFFFTLQYCIGFTIHQHTSAYICNLERW